MTSPTALTITRKLVTIIAPDSAEESLAAEITGMGVGLSILEVRGLGKHGARPDPWHGANVEIRTVMDEATTERLLQRLERKFLPTTDLIVWVSDVEAWPVSRFAPGEG